MKTKLLLFSALIFSLSQISKAQIPSITAANAQVIGDSLTIYRSDTLGLNVGGSGTNVTWNFSALDSIGVLYRYTMSPASTPYPSLYPTSNRAEKTVSGSSINYQFYYTQNDSTATVGISGGVIDSTIFLNTDKSMVFPFTYLNSFYDSSIAFSYYNTSGLKNHSYHSRVTTADGYGTLILPNSTYTNVLRYKVVNNEIDSLFIGTTFNSRFVWYIEEYFWVDAGHRAYLLYANPLKLKNGVPQTRSVHYVRNPYPIASTGIQSGNSRESRIAIYPNPFSSQAVLQTDHVLHNATLTLENIFGETVKQIKNINGQTVTILRDDLPCGSYFVRITEGNRQLETKKLMVVD